MDSDSRQHASGPKQHTVLKVVLGVVAVFVLLALVGAVRGSDNSGGSNSSTSSSGSSDSTSGSALHVSSTPVDQNSTSAAPTIPGLNQPADDGLFQFTAAGFSCGQTYLVNDNEFENATAQGQFCILKLSIKNAGSYSEDFNASDQYLYTDDGTQFSYSYEGTIAANPSGNNCYEYQTINPGNSLSCNVAFDVPKGVTPTYAMLHDSSLSGGVKVNLQ